MSRRRSQSTPLARSGGPVTPSAIASAAESIPTPFSRPIQMGLPVSRSSYWSIFAGMSSRNACTVSKKPFGGSSASPPMRK